MRVTVSILHPLCMGHQTRGESQIMRKYAPARSHVDSPCGTNMLLHPFTHKHPASVWQCSLWEAEQPQSLSRSCTHARSHMRPKRHQGPFICGNSHCFLDSLQAKVCQVNAQAEQDHSRGAIFNLRAVEPPLAGTSAPKRMAATFSNRLDLISPSGHM